MSNHSNSPLGKTISGYEQEIRPTHGTVRKSHITLTVTYMTSGRQLNGPRRKKTCLRGFANNTGADQPALPRSLISAFVIHFLESTIFNLSTRKISNF